MKAKILWPAPGREIEHWGMLLGQVLGANPGFPMDRPVLLGIRGARPNDEDTHSLFNGAAYDDTFVLFSADGSKPPFVFAGSTHAFQKNSKESPDVNHDGVGDVGCIDPGNFVMKLVPGKYPVFRISLQASGSYLIPGHRDLDHDGVPETSGQLLDSILFHVGYDAPADSDHKSSIGCQTASLKYLEKLHDVARNYDAIIYVLRTAESLIEMLNSATVEPFPLDAQGIA